MRKLLALILALALSGPALALTASQRLMLFSSVSGWVMPGASVDLDFANGRYYGGNLASMVSLSRASSGTNLRPTSPSGFAYSTWGSNVPRIDSNGFLIEEARTNLFLNSTAPVTQTISLATGTYTLWVNGSGSITVSAGTAAGCGTGTASNGTSVSIVVTVTGTCVFTVSGSLQAAQLELGAFGTSFIATAAASASRAADIPQLIGPALAAALNAKAAFFQTMGVAGGVSPFMLSYQSAAQNTFFFASATSVRANGSTGAGISATIGGAGASSGLVKSAFGFDASSITSRANGGTAGTSAIAYGTPGTATPYLGNRASGDTALNGYMQRFALSSIKGQFDGMTSP